MKSPCEVCGKNPPVGVYATSIPMSVSYCKECLEAGVEPYWILVCNTNMAGGLENTVIEWQEYVAECLKYFGKTREEFDAAVQEEERKIDEYFANNPDRGVSDSGDEEEDPFGTEPSPQDGPNMDNDQGS